MSSRDSNEYSSRLRSRGRWQGFESGSGWQRGMRRRWGAPSNEGVCPIMDFIEVVESALPTELCEELVSIFNDHPSVSPGVTGSGLDLAKKRSLDLTLDSDPKLRPQLARVQQVTLKHLASYVRKYPFVLFGAVTTSVVDPKTQQAVAVTIENFETLADSYLPTLIMTVFRSGPVNVQKYAAGIGGYPHWHSEVYPQGARSEPLHRVALYMYYLNDVAEGGETEFYFQARKIQPRRGSLVIAPAGFTHTHRGNVPLSGDKYILTSWLLFRRAEQLYAVGRE